MEKILLLVGGAYLGWYLALNKKKEVEQALAQAKREAKELSNEVKDLTDDLKAEINENNRFKCYGRCITRQKRCIVELIY